MRKPGLISHTSYAMRDKREEWAERHLEIFKLPSYSPELNPTGILWRFMKYIWLDASAYKCWQSLVEQVESILSKFGEEYVINFVQLLILQILNFSASIYIHLGPESLEPP